MYIHVYVLLGIVAMLLCFTTLLNGIAFDLVLMLYVKYVILKKGGLG